MVRQIAFIALSALLATSCAVTEHQTSAQATCPPIKTYTVDQQKQVAAELRTLPVDSQTGQWIADYIGERDVLRACAAH